MDRKQLRKAMSPAGWTMALYYLLVNVCVIFTAFFEVIIRLMREVSMEGENLLEGIIENTASSAWGYFLAAGVGILILLLWKKPKFWREEIWKPGKPMKFCDFLGILAFFLTMQLAYRLYAMALEATLNMLGLTLLEGMEAVSAGSDSFSMFLYVGILAPITEEILFRGLIQRTLMPWGRKLAILGSAFLFGMMHGNVLQTPFAFLVGLVLGYVATEYSIAWAMVLHMINNLVLGDMLMRLAEGMGDVAAGLIIWTVLLLSFIGTIIVRWRKKEQIRAWHQRHILGPTYVRCFFSSAGVLTFTVMMVISIIVTFIMMISPL